jgi:hypothetical protein
MSKHLTQWPGTTRTLEFIKTILIAYLALSTTAFANEFDNRVTEGQRSAATPQGSQYHPLMEPAISTAIGVCVPPGSTTPSNTGDFTLVAYVSRDGKLSAVDVQPKTAVAMCFAAQIGTMHLSPPPASPSTSTASRSGYPIVVKMSVRM